MPFANKKLKSTAAYCVTIHKICPTFGIISSQMSDSPIHPGVHVKEHIIPKHLNIKNAAGILKVGRPALSNLLNGKASLSSSMAIRLEKAFGCNATTLLALQAEWDKAKRSGEIKIQSFRAVPSFIRITARDISGWAKDSIEFRNRLAVLLRKLIVSTAGECMLEIDFPGYDNAERKGPDGYVVTNGSTPWVPGGKSVWEFGCNKLPAQKATKDFNHKTKGTPAKERRHLHFLFVTPHNWPGKIAWLQKKRRLRQWKSVKVYDASDLEQWLEQSIVTQAWLGRELRLATDGVQTLEEHWQSWANVTEPQIAKELFDQNVSRSCEKILKWLLERPTRPFMITSDSVGESLAFLHHVFLSTTFFNHRLTDLPLIFESDLSAKKLSGSSSPFIAILPTEDIERRTADLYKKHHTFIFRPKNQVPQADIELELPNYDSFETALKAMGLGRHRIDSLRRQSAYSPTILRRSLSTSPAIKFPSWGKHDVYIKRLVPLTFVGAWDSNQEADKLILALLTGQEETQIEEWVTDYLVLEDCPVWTVRTLRGVISKMDSLFVAQRQVTRQHLETFFKIAELVLSETDPALDLPEDYRWAANIYGKLRKHSGPLRKGICESLVLLSVHGNEYFKQRTHVDCQVEVDNLVRRLLTPLTIERLLSNNKDLPFYAEASPKVFLEIVEEDLKTAAPVVFQLLKPTKGLFGQCIRSEILWAMECLAWNPDYLMRVTSLLARFSEKPIDDNYVNKPENTLLSIFRAWMPQTSATLDERKKAVRALMKKHPSAGWAICTNQFYSHDTGFHNYRPKWRNDAAGSGEAMQSNHPDVVSFRRESLELVLSLKNQTIKTLSDLVSRIRHIPLSEHHRIWTVIKNSATKLSDIDRANLRETIRTSALTKRARRKVPYVQTLDPQAVFDALKPNDVVLEWAWLFKKEWVEESAAEIQSEIYNPEAARERIAMLRQQAVKDIWNHQGFEGLERLMSISGALSALGWNLAASFENCDLKFVIQKIATHNQKDSNTVQKADEVLYGIFHQIRDRDVCLNEVLAELEKEDQLRIFNCMPFNNGTWTLIETLSPGLVDPYWKEVNPTWAGLRDTEINVIIDNLRKAGRPGTAFEIVNHHIDKIETSRLLALLHEIPATHETRKRQFYFSASEISRAVKSLETRDRVTEEQLAELEYIYSEVLDLRSHPLENLSRHITRHPDLFVELLVKSNYKKHGGAKDLPGWQVPDEAKSGVFIKNYHILNNLKFLPSSDQHNLELQAEKKWIIETRALCEKYGRLRAADEIIGRMIANSFPEKGPDGCWPSTPLRELIEELASKDMTAGVYAGVSTQEGTRWGDTVEADRKTAEEYSEWSRQLTYEYPFVSKMLGYISDSYSRNADWQTENDDLAARLSRIE